MGFTNKVKAEMLASFFRGEETPARFFLALVTAANTPGPDTNTLADLTEIAAGNGYVTGGQPIAGNDFILAEENDAQDKGLVRLKNITLTASGGSIPASGSGARYAVLTGPGATISARKVYLWFDLLTERFLTDAQQLQINRMTAELAEA